MSTKAMLWEVHRYEVFTVEGNEGEEYIKQCRLGCSDQEVRETIRVIGLNYFKPHEYFSKNTEVTIRGRIVIERKGYQ